MIYVDMDRVLVDFDVGASKFLGKDTRKHKDLNLPTAITGDDWIKIATYRDFWADLPFMPDGQELWDYIKSDSPTVLSAYPSRYESDVVQAITGKLDWIDRNLSPRPNAHVVHKSEKREYARDHSGKPNILIDDDEENIRQWEEMGGFGILHTDTKSSIEKLKHINKP